MKQVKSSSHRVLTSFVFRPVFRLLFITVLASLLSACGWHLKGQVDLPVKYRLLDTQLQNATQTSQRWIEQNLLSNGVTLSAEAPYTLRIVSETANKRTLSVTGNAKASEYELIQSLQFLVEDQKGQVLTPIVNIESFRTLLYDADAVLGKAQEESALRQEMQKDNASKLLLRLKNLQLNPVPES